MKIDNGQLWSIEFQTRWNGGMLKKSSEAQSH